MDAVLTGSRRIAKYLIAALGITVTACAGTGPAPTMIDLEAIASQTASALTLQAALATGEATLPPTWTPTASPVPASPTGRPTFTRIPTRTPTPTPPATPTGSPLPPWPTGTVQPGAFPRIDDGLAALPGWRYTANLELDGVYSNGDEVSGGIGIQLYFNYAGGSRRLSGTIHGGLFPDVAEREFEYVQLGDVVYRVANGICTTFPRGMGGHLVEAFAAGQVLGGLTAIAPTDEVATVNGATARRYAFGAEAIGFATYSLTGNGSISLVGGELWVSERLGVVIRYTATLDVVGLEGFGEAGETFSGRMELEYNLYDIGVLYDIEMPEGCMPG